MARGGARKPKKPDLRLVRCDYCGTEQRTAKAHPPVAVDAWDVMPPVIPWSRFEEPSDWVAPCRECAQETATGVHAIMAA